MDYQDIRYSVANQILTITLNRPERMNAWTLRMKDEMLDALARANADDEVRVIVVTGEGKAFCAGMDLKEFFIANRDDPKRFEKAFRAAVEWRGRTLRYYPKVTISMINGDCFGGAFSIVEGCDLAVAADEARIGLSEINFKIFPGGSVSKSLANLLRPRDALFYGLTGRPFGGVEAARIGLVNYSVPLAELRDNVMALAHEIAAKDGEALRATKDGYRMSLEMSWEASMDYCLAKQDQLTMRQGGAWQDQGIGGFLDKKYKPGLSGVPE